MAGHGKPGRLTNAEREAQSAWRKTIDWKALRACGCGGYKVTQGTVIQDDKRIRYLYCPSCKRSCKEVLGLNEAPPQMPRPQIVYFIECVGHSLVKIGWSNCVQGSGGRFQSLQTACPFQLALVGIIDHAGFKKEQHLHKKFADQRHLGEWFRFEEPIREYLRDNGYLLQDPILLRGRNMYVHIDHLRE